MRNGYTVTELIKVLSIGAVVGAIIYMFFSFNGCIKDSIIGNKQVFDTNQTFKYALVDFGNGKLEKVEIKEWNDFGTSDTVQIIDKSGKVFYSHLSRMILVDE